RAPRASRRRTRPPPSRPRSSRSPNSPSRTGSGRGRSRRSSRAAPRIEATERASGGHPRGEGGRNRTEAAGGAEPAGGHGGDRVRVLIWHVHGGWMDGFVLGPHEYLIPSTPEGGPWGAGRAGRDWSARAVDVPVHRLRGAEPDVVVLQRPAELELVTLLTGRIPGVDLPAVYLEHNTPPPGGGRHPLADHPSIPIVHVTHFNRLIWDCGTV